MQTFIPGKEAALEVSIAHFQQQLRRLGFTIEEISWLNPVEHIWSVHIRDVDCPYCFANGKGSTAKAALASALGEFLERLSTNYFFADFYLGTTIAHAPFVHYPDEKWFHITDDLTLPEGLLDTYQLACYDPEQALTPFDLIDLQSGNSERGICALPYVRQSDQQTIYIPVNIIGNLYVSNGMAAGNSKNEARVQALSEIFERYVKNKIIAEAISLPRIPTTILARYPTIVHAITQLEQEGYPIVCFDASLGGQYPVICLVLLNPDNSTCFASFGAHPNFYVALERTLTELLQGRKLNELDVFSPPTFANEEVAEHTNLETHFIDSSGLISWDLFCEKGDYPFVDWNFSGTTEEEFTHLLAIFLDRKHEVYIADYDYLGINTCRILVPGISNIYPEDDLLLANNTMAAPLRDTLLDLPNSDWRTEDYLTLIEQIDNEGFDDFTRIRELLGLATGDDNDWATLRVGELKALLALAGGDLSQALIWVDWTLFANQNSHSESTLSAQRSQFYRCLQTILTLIERQQTFDISDYKATFCQLYGCDTVERAMSHITQQDKFYHLFAIDPDLTSLTAHQSLLRAYRKVQQAKQHFYANTEG